jgi:nitrite reductase/ring-hydroxylating ferredoxin subunit
MASNESAYWRTIAFSSHVPPGKPVRVVCGDGDFVLFRDASGVCRALRDRCAHRRAPLSGGRLTKECFVECPYHGWRYDGTGACVTIPNLRPDEKIPKNYRVQAFDTFERDGFIQLLPEAGESTAEPNDVRVANLGRQWQGEALLAYPEPLFVETLIDCPSSILSIPRIQILDDRPFGDPAVVGDRVMVEYAAIALRRTRRPLKQVAADFAYSVRICASKGIVRIEVRSNTTAQLLAIAIIVAVPLGRRVTRVMWRGSAPAVSGAPLTVGIRDYIDATPICASNNFASRIRAEALRPRTSGLDTVSQSPEN